MASRRSAPRDTSLSPAVDPPGVEEADPDLQAYDELDKLRAETGPGSGYSVIVFKRREDGQKPYRCRRFPLHEFDPDQLPPLYGGGDYVLDVMDDHGRYAKRYQVSFDPSIQKAAQPAPASPAGQAAPAVPPGMAEILISMRQEMQAAQQRHQAFLETLVTALVTTRTGGPSMGELIETLKSARSMVDQNPGIGASVVSDAVKVGIELARNASGGGEEGDSMARVIDKVLPLVDKVVSRIPLRGTAARPVTGAAALTAGATPASLPPDLAPYAFIGKWAPQLILWAQKDFSPARAASLIYNAVDDGPPLDALEKIVRMDGAQRMTYLVQVNGQVGPYRDYIDRLAAELVQIFDAEEAEETDDEDAAAESGSSPA